MHIKGIDVVFKTKAGDFSATGLNTATANLATQVEKSLDATVAKLTEMAEKTADDASEGIAKIDDLIRKDMDGAINGVNAKVRYIAKCCNAALCAFAAFSSFAVFV